MEKVNLTDYYEMLELHDWYYEFSDDPFVWREGRGNFIKLSALSRQSEEHRKMFEGFMDHYYSGKAFGTEQKPRPQRPGAEA